MTRKPGTIAMNPSRACKCKKCNAIIQKNDLAYKITTPSTYYYLCNECHTTISSYSTRNNKVNNKVTKHGITLGIEHEQSSAIDYRALLVLGWIPTSDCTVDIEYKSPVYNSLRGLKLTLETLEKAGATSGDSRSGTHCHIGTFSEPELIKIRRAKMDLFLPLYHDLCNNERTTRDFFGRFFGNFRNANMDCDSHNSWLNLYTGKQTIEVRLGKFSSAQQYYRVMILARFIGQVLKSFLGGKISASKAGNKILAIYRKCIFARDVSDIIGNNNRD